jgi:S-adenosylmethionine/arginine decarboxylase-like enzyme
MEKNWGFHLLINASGANLKSISSYDTIKSFAKDIVKKIDMVAYGEPQIVHFGEGNKKGYTLIQLIETSCISAHFVENDGNNNGTGSYYMDIFSCKNFDKDTAIECCEKYFGKTKNTIMFLERQA